MMKGGVASPAHRSGGFCEGEAHLENCCATTSQDAFEAAWIEIAEDSRYRSFLVSETLLG
jgi:hypothetical protein